MEFPEIPEDLTSLSDEELAALADAVRAYYAARRAEDASPDQVADLRQAAEALESTTVEATRRSTEAEATAAELAELDSRVTAPVAVEDPPAEVVTAEDPVAEPEPVAAAPPPASAPARVPARVAAPAPPEALTPRESAPSGPQVAITAAADVPGVPLGHAFADLEQLASAFTDRLENVKHSAGADGEKVPVASFIYNRDDAHTLDEDDFASANAVKIETAVEERQQLVRETIAAWARGEDGPLDALAAAGGLCAPTDNYYGQQVISVDDRPVRGSLTSFTSRRGGLRWNPPPTMSQITSGLDQITAAADAAGGAGAVKACFNVVCNAITSVDVYAEYVCLEFNEFSSRTFPEMVQAYMSLAAAVHARRSETDLLNLISSPGSTATTFDAQLNAVASEVLGSTEQAIQGMRSRQRMRTDAPVEVLLPQWIPGAMRLDLSRTFKGETAFLGVANAEIRRWFANMGAMVTFYKDSPTGKGQVFGAQTAGELKVYPTNVAAYVYPAGTHLHIDNGRLDLGIVRDSALAMGSGSTPGNRWRMFYEDFETLATVGPESLEVLTVNICPGGGYAAAESVTCPIAS